MLKVAGSNLVSEKILLEEQFLGLEQVWVVGCTGFEPGNLERTLEGMKIVKEGEGVATRLVLPEMGRITSIRTPTSRRRSSNLNLNTFDLPPPPPPPINVDPSLPATPQRDDTLRAPSNSSTSTPIVFPPPPPHPHPARLPPPLPQLSDSLSTTPEQDHLINRGGDKWTNEWRRRLIHLASTRGVILSHTLSTRRTGTTRGSRFEMGEEESGASAEELEQEEGGEGEEEQSGWVL